MSKREVLKLRQMVQLGQSYDSVVPPGCNI